MRLQYFQYECAHCGELTQSPQLPEYPYGEFLLRSHKGAIAYFFSLNHKVFNALDDILKTSVGVEKKTPSERAKILQTLLGLIADPAPDGTPYDINQNPLCDGCGMSEFKHYGPVKPVAYVDLDIPSLTFHRWLDRSSKERVDWVHQLMRKHRSM